MMLLAQGANWYKPSSRSLPKETHASTRGLTRSRLYVIAHNILITGEGDTQEEADKDHDTNMRAFLIRYKQRDIILNADKITVS